MIQLGIAGCGRITTSRHLPALKSIDSIRVVACAEQDSRQRTETAQSFGIEKCYGDFEELIADPSIEAVAVCLPPELHHRAAKLVLQSGKHLFLEKPIALDLNDSAELVALSKETPGIAMLGFNLRWHRLIKKTKQLLDQGKPGQIVAVNSIFSSSSMMDPMIPQWRKTTRSGGGALSDQAIHHFDLWRYLFHAEVNRVEAIRSASEKTAVICAELSNGILVNATITQSSTACNEFDIYGDRGRIRVSLYNADGVHFYPLHSFPGSVGTRISHAKATLSALPDFLINREGDYVATYRQEWMHFAECLQKNTQPLCTLEDGHQALKVLLQAIESCSAEETTHDFA